MLANISLWKRKNFNGRVSNRIRKKCKRLKNVPVWVLKEGRGLRKLHIFLCKKHDSKNGVICHRKGRLK